MVGLGKISLSGGLSSGGLHSRIMLLVLARPYV